MKKLVLFFGIIAFAISLTACSGEERTAPVFSGVEDEEVLQGSTFDPMEGVTATDHDGNDITDQIVVDGFVNTNILGEHNLTYTVEDSEGLETSVNRYITVIFETDEPYQAYNGDFSLGTGGWQFDKPGGEADWNVEDEILTVDITNPGSEWWQLQIYQLIEIEEGVTYHISINAKSVDGKTLGLGVEDTTAGYEMIAGGAFAVTLTDSFETYDFYFQSDRTIDAAKLVMYLGQIGSEEADAEVNIDWLTVEIADQTAGNLSIEGVEDANVMLGEPFDPMEGVIGYDGETIVTDSIEVLGVVKTDVTNRTPFVLQYVLEVGDNVLVETRVIDVQIGAVPNRLFNPEFELGVTGWTVDFPGGHATGSMTVVEDVLNVNITDTGDEYWHIQLSQSEREIVEGVTYELSFRAKADGNKTIGLGVENTADNYALLIDSIPQFTLTSEFQTYTYQFTAGQSLETVKYALFFGNMAATDEATIVYIDFFTIREVVASGVSVVENPDMSGDTGWVFDFPVGTGTMSYVDDTVVAEITDTGDAWWHIQLQQAGIQVDAGVTYLVSMTLKSDVERTVGLGLEDADNGFASVINESLNFVVGNEFETFYYVFTPDQSYSNLKIALFLGEINSDPLSTITVDSIDMIVADGQNILENSQFEDDSHWNFEFNETSAGTMSVVDNQVIGEITSVGDAWWHIQIFQENVSIQAGESYLVSFRISSDVARRIGLGIEDPADGWRDLKDGEVVEWDINENMVTYTYVFDAQDTIDTAKFAIFLGWHVEGDGPSNIVVEDFYVIQLVE